MQNATRSCSPHAAFTRCRPHRTILTTWKRVRLHANRTSLGALSTLPSPSRGTRSTNTLTASSGVLPKRPDLSILSMPRPKGRANSTSPQKDTGSKPREIFFSAESARCLTLNGLTNGLSVVFAEVILSSSCSDKYDHLTRPLCSSPITVPSSLVRVDPPQFPASVLSPHGFCRLSFSLAIRKLDPAVPRRSLYPNHAPYTPAAVRTVIRLPADLSQEKKAPLILTTLDTLTTRHRWVCLRSSFGYSPAPSHA